MGQFRIKPQQPAYQMHFREPQAESAQTAAPTPKTPAALATAGDGVQLSGRKSDDKPPEALQIFDATPKAASEHLIERMTTRQSSMTVVGSRTIQLEVGTESAAPELITSGKAADPAQELKTQIQNYQNGAKTSGEQVIRTGAVLQADERLQFQVGMASAVDTDKLLQSRGPNDEAAIKPGVYAGVAVKSETISTRLAIDTAFGTPRVEVGTAVSAGSMATFGVSYIHSAQTDAGGDPQRTLRLGTEVKANQNTVVGVNVNQPLHSGSTTSASNTAVGVYVNAKFD